MKEHELASQPDLDKEIVEKRWNELHRKNAKMVHQHILKYRGLLTKFGGFLALRGSAAASRSHTQKCNAADLADSLGHVMGVVIELEKLQLVLLC